MVSGAAVALLICQQGPLQCDGSVVCRQRVRAELVDTSSHSSDQVMMLPGPPSHFDSLQIAANHMP